MQRQGCELIIAYENSSRSLELLHEGLVHIAGTHLIDKSTGKTDLLPITKLFLATPSRHLLRDLAGRTGGDPGQSEKNRRHYRYCAQGREDHQSRAGAGCRRLLDDLMKQHGIAVSQVKGYDRITLGHLPAARLVQSGEVDCCISTQAGARALGLDFIPLAQKPYHLVFAANNSNCPGSGAAGNPGPRLIPPRGGSLRRLRHAHRRRPSRLTRACPIFPQIHPEYRSTSNSHRKLSDLETCSREWNSQKSINDFVSNTLLVFHFVLPRLLPRFWLRYLLNPHQYSKLSSVNHERHTLDFGMPEQNLGFGAAGVTMLRTPSGSPASFHSS